MAGMVRSRRAGRRGAGARRARPQERARTAARAGGGPAVRGSAQGGRLEAGPGPADPGVRRPGMRAAPPLRAGRRAVRVVEPRVGAARRGRAARPLFLPPLI